jgi:hypothetical protein
MTIDTSALIAMAVLVVLFVGLWAFAELRLRHHGGPRREPGERKPDMVRTAQSWIWPRG